MNRFSDRRNWPYKAHGSVDLCGKSRGFEDVENTLDRGSAVIFDADSG